MFCFAKQEIVEVNEKKKQTETRSVQIWNVIMCHLFRRRNPFIAFQSADKSNVYIVTSSLSHSNQIILYEIGMGIEKEISFIKLSIEMRHTLKTLPLNNMIISSFRSMDNQISCTINEKPKPKRGEE